MKMMVPDHCKDLHDIIFGLMVGVALDKEKKNNSDDRNETNNAYKVMSLTYRICVIYLPIPVTGPEGPSKSLVISLELAFYEISVASQKSLIIGFLGVVYIFSILLPFFHCFVTNVHRNQEWDNDVRTIL
jgi:hypothetical protein